MARLVALALPQTALVTEAQLAELLTQETGGETFPARAWGDLATAVVARAALDQHLVITVPGAEFLFAKFPGLLRVRIAASKQGRIGALLVDRRLARPEAAAVLQELDRQARLDRQSRWGKARAPETAFDLTLNGETLTPEQMARLAVDAARTLGTLEAGFLSSSGEAQMQFQVRLRLAQHGITPPGRAQLKRRVFANRSEEILANLLDFYRIRWEYEPRSFAIAWDGEGQPVEQFAPDFYLPESDIYVELTTMKQSLVTKKNRKVKLLKQHYPEVNIQIFYQRDFQNLIFKHGLVEQAVPV